MRWRVRAGVLAALGVAMAAAPLPATAAGPPLGTARSFAVLGGSTVTNTGPTVIVGDVGVSPGSAITGFPPGTVSGGEIHANDGLAQAAHADAAIAYAVLLGMASVPANNLTGSDLGALAPLPPGVYKFNTSAQLTGQLVLDAQGDSEALFVFQIGSTLTTASNASVVVINGGTDYDESNVFWQIGTSATLGSGTAFTGHILASASITMVIGTTMMGNALALDGAVTMDSNANVSPSTTTTTLLPTTTTSTTTTLPPATTTSTTTTLLPTTTTTTLLPTTTTSTTTTLPPATTTSTTTTLLPTTTTSTTTTLPPATTTSTTTTLLPTTTTSTTTTLLPTTTTSTTTTLLPTTTTSTTTTLPPATTTSTTTTLPPATTTSTTTTTLPPGATTTSTTLIPDPWAPVPPTGLTAITIGAVSCTETDLTWTDVSANETDFRVYRRDGAGPEFLQVGSIATPDMPGTGAVLTFHDVVLDPATTHTYRVTAFGPEGESAPSNEALVDTCGVGLLGDKPTRYLDVRLGRRPSLVIDRRRARTDRVVVRGSYTVVDVNTSVPTVLHDTDPRPDGIAVQVRAPGNLVLVSIPANDPHWKVSKKGIYRWKAPRAKGAPASKVLIDTRKSEFIFISRKNDFGLVPVNAITVSLSAYKATGSLTGAWKTRTPPAGIRAKFKFPKSKRPR